MFHIAWCVVLINDGYKIAETCRRHINCTVVYRVCANLSSVNKVQTYIYIYIYVCVCVCVWLHVMLELKSVIL
jgi:hypothetical protein